jgi:hypothetical protein
MEAVQTLLSNDRVICPNLLPRLHCKPYRYLRLYLYVSVEGGGRAWVVVGVDMTVEQLDMARSY